MADAEQTLSPNADSDYAEAAHKREAIATLRAFVGHVEDAPPAERDQMLRAAGISEERYVLIKNAVA